ncbi:hypothetical protein WJX79_009723 [Trebouxia sp. C0005]
MDIQTGLLTSPDTQQAPTAQLQSLQLGTHKAASVAMHPEFYVILADSTLPGAQYPAVLPPPEPTPKDTTDWGFFWLGLIFPLAWLIGFFRPLFRHPHFPQRQNFIGWLGNVVGTIVLTAIAVAIVIIALKQD